MSQPKVDEVEQLEVALMPLEQVIDVVTHGGIVHTLHVSALFLALARMGRVQ